LQNDATTSFTYILAMNLVLWSSWALFAPVPFLLGRRFPFDRDGWQRALLVHIPAALATTSAHLLLVGTGRFALHQLYGVDADWTATTYDAFFRTLDFELPVYWALLGLQHAGDYYQQGRMREVQAAHLETKLVEAQLLALQHQLHPHFLFNTLHAISALIHRDPDRADDMLERLSDLLRMTLRKVGVQEVPLADELDYLRVYLAIEQLHFGDRLSVMYRIDAEVVDAVVPTLILQPLAENAIRHGLEPQPGHGTLTIDAARVGNVLRIRVIDTGRGFRRPHQPLKGVGLSNSHARLSRLYGSEAALSINDNPGGGSIVEIALPFQRASTTADNSPTSDKAIA
jgi:signal transduction histidine kinase